MKYCLYLSVILVIAIACKHKRNHNKENTFPRDSALKDGGNILVVPRDSFLFEEMVYRETEKGIDTLNYVSIDIRTGRLYCSVAKDLPLGMRVKTTVDNGTYRSTSFDIEYYDLKDVKLKKPFAERSNYDDLRAKIVNALDDSTNMQVSLYGNFEKIPGAPAGGSRAYHFTYMGGGKDAYIGSSERWGGYRLLSYFLHDLYKEKAFYRQVIADGRETSVRTRSL